MCNNLLKRSFLKTAGLSFLILLLVSAALHLASPISESAPTNTTPQTMVYSGVNSYDLVGSKIFYHTEFACENNNEFPSLGQFWDEPVTVKRVGVLGSPQRTLFSNDETRPEGTCNPYHIRSNVVSDGEYAYWANNSGIVRLPVEANATDTAQVVHSQISHNESSGKMELAVSADDLYAITHNLNGGSTIRQLSKTPCAVLCTGQFSISTNSIAHGLSFKGQRVYWVEDDRLMQAVPGNLISTLIASNVTGYYAEGVRSGCSGLICSISDLVFVAQGNQLRTYNHITNTLNDPIYTSPDSDDFIYSIVASGSEVLFLEARPFATELFTFYNQVLMRTNRSGNSNAECTYSQTGIAPVSVNVDHLKAVADYVLWQEDDKVLRLPADAEACTPVNISIDQVMVTQAVQNDTNSVPLVQGKRTYVRVTASTDGPVAEGVTAHLYRLDPTNQQILDGPLLPVNGSGPYQTLTDEPRDDAADGNFIFIVPRDWLIDGINKPEINGLSLSVTVNPYDVPIETNKSDNTEEVAIGVVSSPRLGMYLYAFEYMDNGKLMAPDVVNDIIPVYSSLKRVFPIDSDPPSPTNLLNPKSGLQAALIPIQVPGLGERVTLDHPSCALYEDETEDGGFDWRFLCGIDFANQELTRLHDWGFVSPETMFYGLIEADMWNGGGSVTGINSRVGSSYVETGGFKDTVAHEVAHGFGLLHPASDKLDDPNTDANESCGHSQDDSNYPYSEAQIGITDKLWGFDPGNFDQNGNPTRKLHPADESNSLMSYCSNRWISDYNYLKMWSNLTTSSALMKQPELLVQPSIGVYGLINQNNQTAVINSLLTGENSQTMSGQVIPAEIRLVDGNGNVLKSYDVIAHGEHGHGSTTPFGQVVPFAAGTQTVQIVWKGSNKVMASQSLSDNSPALSGLTVEFVEDESETDGNYQLNWSASDADGDALTFDVLYSQDNGNFFQPVVLGLKDPTALVDPDKLAGGKGVFKVIAYDGTHQTELNSEMIEVRNKAPEPYILEPADNSTVEWGQMVTLVGEAFDKQFGGIDPAKYEWSNQYGPLGTGGILDIDDLPVGENTITLKVTNENGLDAETSITIFVGDTLAQPGPTPSVTPLELNWHFGTLKQELFEPENKVISIYNLGTGDLGEWMVTDPVDWLEVVADPEENTVKVIPDQSVLEPGVVFTTELTITFSDFEPPQQFTIPVMMTQGVIGPGFETPDNPTGDPLPIQIFLPVMTRQD